MVEVSPPRFFLEIHGMIASDPEGAQMWSEALERGERVLQRTGLEHEEPGAG